MKRKYFLNLLLFFVVGLALSKSSSAQTVSPKESVQLRADSVDYSDENFSGTFQIIHHTKQREIITVDWYPLIEEKRSDNLVVMWKISPLTTLRIFPRNVINPPASYRVPQHEIVIIEEEGAVK